MRGAAAAGHARRRRRTKPYKNKKKNPGRGSLNYRDLEKSSFVPLVCHLFNMYREDTHSFNLNDPRMQIMSYF